ncbi:quinone-dependent dihydroorotate dehydrogenase [Methylacidimicrobium sp. B4]|uniref:quinone-dependent dihydroorotate dehydrogenase n=1 Tax=Methylacidimicrobium sp. B4 TaxID=2796139 RepID=UPI001A8CDD6B|nr:quinone-dependent dihydroorotate dehydrogenase [Methylacidimicrobium sp. B4]QSR83966.1 quinone-dependent dihydroorotate dehydrogenase [Methylacidimicrobium sp. B4]
MLYRLLLRRLLFFLPPERAHHLALSLCAKGWAERLLRRLFPPLPSGLERTVWGLRFPSPLGLAAGFDKNGIALGAWEALGFGFCEIGTVTPTPQAANPPPRLRRLPRSEALWNRLGFPSEGAEQVARRLAFLRAEGRWPSFPVGINVGKSRQTELDRAAEDYARVFSLLRAYGDFFVLNLSSPNTPGLRSLQQETHLRSVLEAVAAVNPPPAKPILVKIAPDLEERALGRILEVLLSGGCDGLVATNTLPAPDPKGLVGGLSGKPLSQRSTAVVRFLARESGGRLPIIAAGGIFDGADAREKLEAGASLLEAYTGFVFQGPGFAHDVGGALLGTVP